MTGIALVARRNMVNRLASRNVAVVAIETCTDDLGMIDRGRGYRLPGGRVFLMAGITHITG